jgi:D-glycero-D-manno-heptose 1,7-bisphosphate phosphatase
MKNKKKAFFLDRDGVINKDIGYLSKISQFKWLFGAKRAIKLLNDHKYKVIVISNQAGVAKGHIKPKFLKELNLWINKSLSKNNARIDRFYYCLHHIDGKVKRYKFDSYDRKPKPGMLLKAIKRYDLNIKDCFMIGDRKKDFLAAKAAKINFFYQKKDLFKQVKKIINV